MRTPKNIIEKAKSYFDKNQIVNRYVDKKAYLIFIKDIRPYCCYM